MATGIAVLREPATYKHTAYTADERETLGLTGLLPAGDSSTMEKQVTLVMETLQRLSSDLSKYEFLCCLADTDRNLFFGALLAHTATLMPLVYTPAVGAGCINYSKLLIPRRGIYISLKDKGHVREVLAHWPHAHVKAIVVTDGERILGLGDLGANGMGIPVGKLSLYTALAGVHPDATLPVTLDVGTNTQSILEDPFYIGARHKREQGEAYYELVEEFVSAVHSLYGKGCLIQWEDFGNKTAFNILHKYQDTSVSFNDDIQGTASVVLAGLLAAPPLSHVSFEDGKYCFFGAGEAGVGIADLVAYALAKATGKPIDDMRKRIFLVDSKGLVVSTRTGLEHHKLPYAHEGHPEIKDLVDIIHYLQPSGLIGVSAQPNSFTKEVVEAMCAHNAHPCIFALSNPTSKAECTAAQAYEWSNNSCVFASGSPFDPVPVTLADGTCTTLVPGQSNNSWIFPAVGLAVLGVNMTHVGDRTMYVAAQSLASQVTKADLDTGCLFPPLSTIRSVSAKIALAIAEDAYAHGEAALSRPTDLEAHLRSCMWEPSYGVSTGPKL